MSSFDIAAYRHAGIEFYKDFMGVALRPGDFFESMPKEKSPADALRFLCICAGIYSVAATIFVHESHFLYFFMFVANGLFVPVATAMVLSMVLYISGASDSDYPAAFRITAYAAGATLLLAWIPGMAPFAEILKYYLIGTGLVKTVRIGTAKAIAVLLATIAILLVMLYLFKVLTGIA